jgi:hypothetical protein
VLVRTDTAAWRRVIASARSSLQATSQLLYQSNNGPEARGISDINLILINKDKVQFIEPLTVLGAGKVSPKALAPKQGRQFHGHSCSSRIGKLLQLPRVETHECHKLRTNMRLRDMAFLPRPGEAACAPNPTV